MSRWQINVKVADFAESSVGVDKKSVLGLLEYNPGENQAKNNGNSMTFQVKQCIKYGRRLGVHVSPTVFWNGIEETQISSSWTGEEWMDWLNKKSTESVL